MSRQYNFSPEDNRPATDGFDTVLALDTGSPLVSVAVSIDGEIVAERSTRARHSSNRLLEMIDHCLRQARIEPQAIDLLLGVRGPGSFTGLRVGLATLQGLRLALETPAATITTFQVLASVAENETQRVIACVDSLRDKWMTHEFKPGSPSEPVGEPLVGSAEELERLRATSLVGFGISQLRSRLDPRAEITLVEPGPLAGHAIRLLGSPEEFDWSPGNLSNPLYLSPPAVSRPVPRV